LGACRMRTMAAAAMVANRPASGSAYN
jgi:hypothetical protein